MQRHRGKGFVDLEQVDLAGTQAGLGQRLLRGRHRTGQHQRGFHRRQARAQDARARTQAKLLPDALAADQHQACTIDDPRGVAGSVHGIDLVEFRIALARYHGVGGASRAAKGRLERRQRRRGGFFANVFVVVQHHQPAGIAHRYQRA
ncbi:hypothetical protein D9M72_521080 [compost metagenome]